jgi:transcriptional regulator with XRE-family HTH domain
MTGLDLEKLAKSDPTVALASGIVKFVNQVAALMRGFRAQTEMSQARMAELMGVSQPRIAQLESGKPGNAPSLEQLAEYAFHTGKVLSICDSAQLAAMGQEHQTLALKAQAYETRLHEQDVRIRRQQEHIRELEHVMIMGRTAGELSAKHAVSGSRGIGVRLKEMFVPVSTPSFDEVFAGRYLTKLEVAELATSVQTLVREERTPVHTVLNAVTDVIQRHVSMRG